MTALAHWKREGWFLLRDKTTVSALLILLLMSTVSVIVGLQKIEHQREVISEMIAADKAEREGVQSTLTTYGDAGYYSFYITYDTPSPLAFAALGQRDTAPFMKRIRLLAIEGQIYQGESPNPLLAQIGSFDLAFVAAYILPLIMIVLLYDLKSSERAAGREIMLYAMPYSRAHVWWPRAGWRAGLAFLCVAGPVMIGAAAQGADMGASVSVVLGILATCMFWTIVAIIAANRPWRGTTIAASLVGIWLALNILAPLTAQLVFISQVEGPDGADVALLQREAVNDAWDKPKQETLKPFATLFPQYAVSEQLGPFDWRWYFAFQTMGDAAASDISSAYRDAIYARDDIAARTAWVSPALAIQRHLQRLAKTDVRAQLSHDAAIRAYHEALQAFYFPLIFGKREDNLASLQAYPRFMDAAR